MKVNSLVNNKVFQSGMDLEGANPSKSNVGFSDAIAKALGSISTRTSSISTEFGNLTRKIPTESARLFSLQQRFHRVELETQIVVKTVESTTNGLKRLQQGTSQVFRYELKCISQQSKSDDASRKDELSGSCKSR